MAIQIFFENSDSYVILNMFSLTLCKAFGKSSNENIIEKKTVKNT